MLGSRQSNVAASLGKSTGLDAGSVLQLLTMLAPLVMGALGKAKRQDPRGSGGLADILGGATRQVDQQAPDLQPHARARTDQPGVSTGFAAHAVIPGWMMAATSRQAITTAESRRRSRR